MRVGVHALGVLLFAAIHAGCNGSGTNGVTLEAANAVSQNVPSTGGSLQATASDGTVYTLEIPDGALPMDTTITMTPIRGVGSFPLSGALVGGVDLQPEGLSFPQPLTLTIESGAAPGAGEIPIALIYEGNAESFELAAGVAGPGTFTLLVPHFSGATMGFGTQQDLSSLAPANGASNQFFLGQFMSATSASPRDAAFEVQLLEDWFDDVILPQIQNAADDVQLVTAVSDYNSWFSVQTLYGTCDLLGGDCGPTIASRIGQADGGLVPQIRQAINRNNDVCDTQESFAALGNVLFWQVQAAYLGIDTLANSLDRETVIRFLCVRVVTDDIQLPDDLQVGFPHSLDLAFGLEFGGRSPSQGAPFRVEIVATGADVQNAVGFTNPQGSYTTVVTATQDGGVSVTARACLILPGSTTPTDICGEAHATSASLDLTGLWDGTYSSADLQGNPLSGVFELNLVQNQNAVTGTLAFASTGTAVPICRNDAGFSATLSGTQLLNVAFDFGGGCVATGTGSVNGDRITASVVGPTSCIEGNGHISITVTRSQAKCQ